MVYHRISTGVSSRIFLRNLRGFSLVISFEWTSTIPFSVFQGFPQEFFPGFLQGEKNYSWDFYSILEFLQGFLQQFFFIRFLQKLLLGISFRNLSCVTASLPEFFMYFSIIFHEFTSTIYPRISTGVSPGISLKCWRGNTLEASSEFLIRLILENLTGFLVFPGVFHRELFFQKHLQDFSRWSSAVFQNLYRDFYRSFFQDISQMLWNFS